MKQAQGPDLQQWVRAVHLGLAILLGLVSLPFFGFAVYGWMTADQFSGFANYREVMLDTAQNAFVKGLVCAGAGVWLLVLWRSMHRKKPPY